MSALASFGLALVAAVAIAGSAYVTATKLRAGDQKEEADTVLLIIAFAAIMADFFVAPSSSDDKAPATTAKQVQA